MVTQLFSGITDSLQNVIIVYGMDKVYGIIYTEFELKVFHDKRRSDIIYT